MRIIGSFPFKDGENVIRHGYAGLLADIEEAIASIDVAQHRTKVSKEVTMTGRVLFNPRSLNAEIAGFLKARGWRNQRVVCQYSASYYVSPLPPTPPGRRLPDPFRDMDFVKDKLGVEVQFGKYAFMVYNVCAKMTIFHKLGLIDAGIEVVPVKAFADQMSTGVSFFEQIVWDLEQRGPADIDIPVLVLGIGE